MPSAAQLAFWNRTAECSVNDLETSRLESRSLVRFWDQRNTVHMYATTDWPFLHSAFEQRQSLLQKKFAAAGLLGEFRRTVGRTAKRLADGQVLTYKDINSKRLQEGQDKWVVSYVIFMQLVREGVACHGPDLGNQSTFAHREHWLPDLAWSPPGADAVFPLLAERYFATYGPAEARDLAFWYGTGVNQAKTWIAAVGKQLTTIEVDGEPRWCRRADLEQLSEPPPSRGAWPVRLLGRFDVLLLATKDKSWLIDEEHYKKVWRPAAHVEAVLLVAGRIAGTWSYERKAAGLRVRLTAFARLPKTVIRAAERQATAIAQFQGTELADLRLDQP